ncbi:MAG: hypothetical protein WA996_08245 [Candidatus Promineifilaceae bacterium]
MAQASSLHAVDPGLERRRPRRFQPAVALHLVAASRNLNPANTHHIRLALRHILKPFPQQAVVEHSFIKAWLAKQAVPGAPVALSQAQSQQSLRHRMAAKGKHFPHYQSRASLKGVFLLELRSMRLQ